MTDVSKEAVDALCETHAGYLQHGTAATLQALRAALDGAEARAVKAEAERDAANALLRDGLLSVQTWRSEPIVNWAETVAAHLGAKP